MTTSENVRSTKIKPEGLPDSDPIPQELPGRHLAGGCSGMFGGVYEQVHGPSFKKRGVFEIVLIEWV